MIPLQVATGSGTPIYRQIHEQVVRGIAAGNLSPGEQMPSVRVLAERLLVNPNTVARAYSDLVRDGVLESRHGRGVFVGERRQVFSAAERSRRLERAIETFLGEAALLNLGAEQVREAVERKLKGWRGGR